MKAAILVELNKPLVIADVEPPAGLACGQVRVRVRYTTICGAQINEIQGAKGPDRFLPHLLGHEGSGVVEEVGAGVTHVQAGDHVVLHWRPSEGIQAQPPKYRWGDRVVNAGWVTTFNEQAVVSENRLTVIPSDFDMRVAPLFGCAVTTAVGVVNHDAGVRIGQSVVVFGAGGVGACVCQAAAMVSAYPIVAVDVHDAKLELARRFGATHAVNSRTHPAYLDEIRAAVGAAGADVAVETTGLPAVIEAAYDLTHADGKTILVGVPTKGNKVSLYTLPLHFKKVLTGSHGGSAEPHVEIPRLIRLIRAGRMSLDGMIGPEFPLERINDAIQWMRDGGAGRCLIPMVQQ